ncbi:MAG TPA: histidine triad (HIT) protein [Spirochaetia bacterium]|nr:MAG: hypothetical protein A2Y41_03280 [Spirochaetes bacterium GWB1_36_13]HCL57872.1 histidine triad (HIT) protein [Spirochaetia bacterium]
MKRKHLFPLNKISYLKDKKFREENCILCKIIEKDSQVFNLLVYEGKKAAVTLNLYPYNAGHLMIFPMRHIEDIREMSKEEEDEISILTKISMNLLDKIYSPGGYNLGYNIGKASGASIAHIHRHVVPRFPNELGFIDILSGSKIIVEDPKQTLLKLKEFFRINLEV